MSGFSHFAGLSQSKGSVHALVPQALAQTSSRTMQGQVEVRGVDQPSTQLDQHKEPGIHIVHV